jgi:hypothetical protein
MDAIAKPEILDTPPRFPHRGVGPAPAGLGGGAPIHNEKRGAGFSTFLGNFSLDKCAAASVSAHLPTPNSDIAYMYEVGFLLHTFILYF